jgi:hypothetical protein
MRINIASPALIKQCSVDGVPYAPETDVVAMYVARRHLLQCVWNEAAFAIVHLACSFSLGLVPLQRELEIMAFLFLPLLFQLRENQRLVELLVQFQTLRLD